MDPADRQRDPADRRMDLTDREMDLAQRDLHVAPGRAAAAHPRRVRTVRRRSVAAAFVVSACACAGVVPRVPAGPSEPADIGIRARRATFRIAEGGIEADDVRVEAPGVLVEARRLDASGPPRRIRLLDANLTIESPAGYAIHGRADELEIEMGRATIAGGTLSRCPLGDAGWTLTFAEACADADDLHLRDVALRIADRRVLWLPWAWLRAGRVPGLRVPTAGSRPGRGPFLGLSGHLPAGDLGDFEVGSTAFPMDGVDVSAAWTRGGNRIDLVAAGVDDAGRLAGAADVSVPLPHGGALMALGAAAQPGLDPAGIVLPAGRIDPATSPPSLRADAFALVGGRDWSLAAGAIRRQELAALAARGAAIAAPALRFDVASGFLDDVFRFPGAYRLERWDPPEAAGSGEDSALFAGWRQAAVVSLPAPEGVTIAPFAVAAGRVEAAGAGDAAWFGAGADAAVAIERRWEGGAYHRASLRARYARSLHVVDGDAVDREIGPGPDLLRISLPQLVRVGGATLHASAWAEPGTLADWDPAAFRAGMEIAVRSDALAVDLRAAADGRGDPSAVLAALRLPAAGPADLAIGYAYLRDGVDPAGLFLPWEDRLALGARPAEAGIHGLSLDVAARFAGGRLALGAGADADIVRGTPAALRFSLVWDDPGACLRVSVAAAVRMDDPMPAVSVSVGL